MAMTHDQLNDLRQRVLKVRRGELPADSVTDDELREAVDNLRSGRVTSNTAKVAKAAAKPGGIIVNLSDLKL